MEAQVTKLQEDMAGTHQVVKALVEANTGNLRSLATRLDVIAQHLKNQTGFSAQDLEDHCTSNDSQQEGELSWKLQMHAC